MTLLASIRTVGTAVVLVTAVAPVGAQSGASKAAVDSSSIAARQQPPQFATGVTVGTLRFNGGRTADALAVVLQLQPRPWLTFSATPGYSRTTLGSVTNSGFADVPLAAGASYEVAMVPWSPSVSGVLYTTIARSDTSNPLGLGHSNYGAQLAVNAWATEYLNTAVALGRPLSANSGNAAMDLEVALTLHRTTATLGFSSELGHADSGAVLARSLAGGVAVSVAGPLTLTVDASHGLTTGAPRWTLSVGLGTAFGGVSPLSPSSPLRRLKKTLGAKVAGTSGYSKSSSGSTSCKKVGTC